MSDTPRTDELTDADFANITKSSDGGREWPPFAATLCSPTTTWVCPACGRWYQTIRGRDELPILAKQRCTEQHIQDGCRAYAQSANDEDMQTATLKAYNRLIDLCADVERELAEAREDAANQRRLADLALAHRDVIIAERDTLAEALGYLMQSCESIDCEAMMPAAMPFAYIKAKQALAAVKGGSHE